MAEKKYDGVIEAVHFTPDGQVDWVRAYLRRGIAWADYTIIKRQDLIKEIQSGKKMMLGKRIEFMAGTFDVTLPVKVLGTNGQEVLSTSAEKTDRDCLEGAQIL